MNFNFSNYTSKIIQDFLSSHFKNKPIRDKMINNFIDPSILGSTLANKALIEHIETNLGNLIEDVLNTKIQQKYTIIQKLQYSNGKSIIDYPLIDNSAKEIILLELKTSISTYNSSSKQQAQKKLLDAKSKLMLTYPSFTY
jgi:hypothetical protein